MQSRVTAKFHYTGPTRPGSRTKSDRARVAEFSYKPTRRVDFGPVFSRLVTMAGALCSYATNDLMRVSHTQLVAPTDYIGEQGRHFYSTAIQC